MRRHPEGHPPNAPPGDNDKIYNCGTSAQCQNMTRNDFWTKKSTYVVDIMLMCNIIQKGSKTWDRALIHSNTNTTRKHDDIMTDVNFSVSNSVTYFELTVGSSLVGYKFP